MKRVFFATLGLVAIFMVGACSSATEEKSSANANSGTETVQNGTKISPQATNANEGSTVAADPLAGPDANRLQGKLKDLRESSNEPVDNAKAEAIARKNARPAPDDSTFASFLTDAGYEIRTFNNHPQLLKVEKRVGTDGQTIKVFLRGGRVVELPGNAITGLANVPAATILAAAGVQQNTATQRPSKTDPASETKKPGN